MADIRVAGERPLFDAGVWDEEVERFDRDGLAHPLPAHRDQLLYASLRCRTAVTLTMDAPSSMR